MDTCNFLKNDDEVHPGTKPIHETVRPQIPVRGQAPFANSTPYRHTHAQRLRCVDRPTGIRPDRIEQSPGKGYKRPERPNKIIKHLHCTFNRPVHGLD